MMLERQSTTVPKTSKVSALIFDGILEVEEADVFQAQLSRFIGLKTAAYIKQFISYITSEEKHPLLREG